MTRRPDLIIAIPEGYEVMHLDRLIADATLECFAARWLAERRCARRNADNASPLYRFEVARYDDDLIERARLASPPAWYQRWAVVPMQNRLVRS